MVDVLAAGDGRVRLDARERNPSGAYRLLRAAVVSKLSEAAAALPSGIGLLVVEGWRDPPDQHRRFTAYLQRLACQHPHLDEHELRKRAATFVAPVEVAPHCTGGAVDLTLVHLATGTEQDLGGAVNAHRTGDDRSCPFAAPTLHPDARARRRLLATAMHRRGVRQVSERVVALVDRRTLLGRDHGHAPSHLRTYTQPDDLYRPPTLT